MWWSHTKLPYTTDIFHVLAHSLYLVLHLIQNLALNALTSSQLWLHSVLFCLLSFFSLLWPLSCLSCCTPVSLLPLCACVHLCVQKPPKLELCISYTYCKTLWRHMSVASCTGRSPGIHYSQRGFFDRQMCWHNTFSTCVYIRLLTSRERKTQKRGQCITSTPLSHFSDEPLTYIRLQSWSINSQ